MYQVRELKSEPGPGYLMRLGKTHRYFETCVMEYADW